MEIPFKEYVVSIRISKEAADEWQKFHIATAKARWKRKQRMERVMRRVWFEPMTK